VTGPFNTIAPKEALIKANGLQQAIRCINKIFQPSHIMAMLWRFSPHVERQHQPSTMRLPVLLLLLHIALAGR
jgi:hypothetical protein